MEDIVVYTVDLLMAGIGIAEAFANPRNWEMAIVIIAIIVAYSLSGKQIEKLAWRL